MSQFDNLSPHFKEALAKLAADLAAKKEAASKKTELRVAMDQTNISSEYEEIVDPKEASSSTSDK